MRETRQSVGDDAQRDGDRRHFGRGGEKGGDRRRRAFVDVGRPHVERHGRHFEREAREQEDEAEDDADLRASRQRLGDAVELHRAGIAVSRSAP